jgi:RimJ/RimL family protein N-acetyltransferase
MTETVILRAVADADLPYFFEHQLDPEAVHMAAFTAANPADRAAFDAHWAKIRADTSVMQRTVVVGDGDVAGWVGSYGPPDEPEVTYWLGRGFWGRGLATAALRLFLELDTRRPMYGRAAADNAASLRVLAKCGFTRLDSDRGYANARGQEIDEVRLILQA